MNYEATLTPGIFSAADETISYEFSGAQTPEPGTLLPFVTGLGGVIARASRGTRRAGVTSPRARRVPAIDGVYY